MKYVFIYKKGKSAKIWGCDLFRAEDGSGHVIWYWGCVGKHMHELTQKKTEYDKYFDAHDAVMERIEDKKRKGYERCFNGAYFDAVMQFRIQLEELIKEANLEQTEKKAEAVGS